MQSKSKAIDTALLEAQYGELQHVIVSGTPESVMIEAADVIHLVERIAGHFGVTAEMLSTYMDYKQQLRTLQKRDKELEADLASGIVNRVSSLRRRMDALRME